ncbi:MAG: monofunctional biosynthetic peptidoglycan transglycosylase [Bacteroidia bacterium]
MLSFKNVDFQKVRRWIGKAILYFFAISILSVIVFRFVPIPFTPLMLQRSLSQLVSGEPVIFQKDWVSLDNISENMVTAVVAAEDQKFEDHTGFDMEAIEKAIEANKKLRKKKKPIRGGSTISQQTAKNVFLFPSRTWLRKGFEAYFTLLIELFWSKERIIEVYLNVIEMGNGIYGAEAAAQTFFHKSAAQLRPSEAATIAAVLPNPRKFSAKNPSSYVIKRRNWIVRQMNHLELDLNK